VTAVNTMISTIITTMIHPCFLLVTLGCWEHVTGMISPEARQSGLERWQEVEQWGQEEYEDWDREVETNLLSSDYEWNDNPELLDLDTNLYPGQLNLEETIPVEKEPVEEIQHNNMNVVSSEYDPVSVGVITRSGWKPYYEDSSLHSAETYQVNTNTLSETWSNGELQSNHIPKAESPHTNLLNRKIDIEKRTILKNEPLQEMEAASEESELSELENLLDSSFTLKPESYSSNGWKPYYGESSDLPVEFEQEPEVITIQNYRDFLRQGHNRQVVRASIKVTDEDIP